MEKPRIMITPALSDNQNSLLINRGYYDSVLRAGGIPILLPLTDDHAVLDMYLASADGVLFSGGPDVHPSLYGEPVHPQCGKTNELRDTMELYLFRRLFSDSYKPVFCICRGIQILNVALGGKLLQDIPSEFDKFVFSHSQPEHEREHAHRVDVNEGTLLSQIVQSAALSVNSLHHQAILQLAPVIKLCFIKLTHAGISSRCTSLIIGISFSPFQNTFQFQKVVNNGTVICDAVSVKQDGFDSE